MTETQMKQKTTLKFQFHVSYRQAQNRLKSEQNMEKIGKRVKKLCESGQNFKKSHSERSEIRN